jgi:hypothetical protein
MGLDVCDQSMLQTWRLPMSLMSNIFRLSDVSKTSAAIAGHAEKKSRWLDGPNNG